MQLPKSSITRTALRGIVAAACLVGASAQAITVKVKVENLSQSDGLWFTPVFFGFHNGSFDTFDPGVAATPGIELIAEEGNPSGLVSGIGSVPGAKYNVLTQDDSGAPPGVLFAPGESAYFTTTLDAVANRYLSFASMILPSNDAFFGNSNPTAWELFDVLGNFNGALQIDITGNNIYDAGTELNDFMGAPFSPLGGMSTDTMGSVQLLGQDGLNAFNGVATAPGGNLSSSLNVNDQFARISVYEVPAQAVPDSTQYIGFLGAFAVIGFRLLSRKRMGKESA